MIKNLSVLFVAALIIAGCKINNFELKGKLRNSEEGKYIYLDELQSNNLVTVDSSRITGEGSFSFSGRVKYPSFYLLRTDKNNFLTMLLEPGQNIDFQAYYDSLSSPLQITGSEGTALMIMYNKKLQQAIRQLAGLREIYIQKLGTPELPAAMERIDSIAQTILYGINSFTRTYIDENLNSLVSLFALYQQVAPREYVLKPDKDLEYYLKVDSALSLLYPDYEPVKSLHNEVTEMISLNNSSLQNPSFMGPGTEAPEISLPSPAGDTIKLSSTRGKIVLLDFWASWCTPCRRENPSLVKVYDTYQTKGFEIYQVSLDKTREDRKSVV